MYDNIKKVHVIFKTHLDIGYTDLSSRVLDKYITKYIPRAIALARELNAGSSEKQFIWTVGSFLVDYYLRHADAKGVADMERAILDGDICWHALSTTTHTELMDQELLDFSLRISAALDARFGKKTTGGKMTDVPGHTIGMVPALASHGIKYLHIGVNCGSPMPDVPELFMWKNGDSEVMVHYSSDYGAPLVIKNFDEAIEYAYTGDNTGPQSKEQILYVMDNLRKKYPNAKVVASTITDFQKSIYRIKDTLPVITEEIGDTWIHGCGTDPLKVSQYMDLLRLKSKWLASGQMSERDEFYHPFMTNLLLVTEHTWSVDLKKYLMDFTNWDKESFQKARKQDTTTIDLVPPCYASLRNIIIHENNIFRNGSTTGSYSFYESSQKEQTAYINQAVEALPENLKQEAIETLARRAPHHTSLPGTVIPMQTLSFGDWLVRVATDGSLCFLQKGNRVIVDSNKSNQTFAKLIYEIFDAITVKNSQYRYNVHLERNLDWTEADFAKPGLERLKDLKDTVFSFSLVRLARNEDTLTAYLIGDEVACNKYGCPRQVELTYNFGKKLHVNCSWFDKDASRIPEAIWLGFALGTENHHRWKMQKINTLISPYDVVSGGNRKMHIVPSWHYSGADGNLILTSLHAPLCSVGGRGLYNLDNRVDSLENGFYYNLFNNRWGTNYKTWCEDDVSLDFELYVN